MNEARRTEIFSWASGLVTAVVTWLVGPSEKVLPRWARILLIVIVAVALLLVVHFYFWGS